MKKKTARRSHRVTRTHKKKSFISLFSLTFLLIPVLVLGTFLFMSRQSIAVKGAASPDEIIVRFNERVTENEKQSLHKQSKTTLKEKIEKLNIDVLKVHEGTVDEKIKQLQKNPLVAYAEPNFKAEAFVITNDTSLPQQWGLFSINAANSASLSAWDVTQGNASVKVAILDTGIEATHPDLVDKVVGSNNFTDSPTINDQHGHGTHVAGITAASTNNGTGVAGTGYNTVLLNGKVLNDSGSGYYSWIANGIIWATDNGAQVINMSLGGTSSSQALADAIDYAWSKGVVVVAAAGNSNTSSPHYPAYYSSVIAVAATTTADVKASYSNYGSWVDVAAPGSAIYSTYKGNTYSSLSGTSMATPFVAGTAALVWASGDCTTNTCVREKLEKTADKISGTGNYWTWGRINAYKAVAAVENTPTPTDIPSPTPTNTPIPTNTPAPTTVTSPLMTVSDIIMSFTKLSGTNRQIATTVTVVNESTNAPLASARVYVTITSPSGKNANYSSTTNATGKVSFSTRSREKGTFTATVTNVTRSAYSYHPTITSKSLFVQ